jgi:hypothetical protein
LIALAGLRHVLGSRVPEPFNPESRPEQSPIETVLEV